MNHKLETLPGDNFDNVAKKAKNKASCNNQVVKFDFNGVTCVVDHGTNLEWLRRDYMNTIHAMGCGKIGPNCQESYDRATHKEFDRRSKIKKESDKQFLQFMELSSDQQSDEKTAGNQEFKKIYLKWLDSTGYDGWVDKRGYKDTLQEIETFAFLIHEYEDRIIVCSHVSESQLHGIMIIPKSVITEQEFINHKRE